MAFDFDNQINKRFVTKGRNKNAVTYSEITYIEYGSDIAKIHFINSDPIYDTRTLKNFIENLHDFGFYQIDKNVIINGRYVTHINSKDRKCFIKVAGVDLKVSRSKQKEMKELFKEDF